ncbi:MAG TPA: lipid II flippase MurJ, partial [Candidatus Eisenbacteria bacterium]|nr:lipid II flippase MurJ [Candidatus Eisenbacteria bacterium]
MSQRPPEPPPPPPGGEPPPEAPSSPADLGAKRGAAGTGATSGRGVARAAGVISAATFVSRLLGLVREQVFAIQFGAGYAVDAFQVAFRIPNLLRDLFAEGAMNAAFVPTLTQAEHRGGRPAALRLANLVINLLLVKISLICLLGILAAPWLVRVMAPGFADEPGKLGLTTLLTQIMMPYLLFVSLAAAAMGFLNTRRVFFVPALSPTMLNVGLIAAGFLLAPLMPRFGLE